MTDTVFTCGHALCVIDGINLYDVELTYEHTRMLGEHLTGVEAPSRYMNTAKLADISLWVLGLQVVCADPLKRQMVRQYPAMFLHGRLNQLIWDDSQPYETMCRLYRQRATDLGIHLESPLTVTPLSFASRWQFQTLLDDPAFQQNCLKLLNAGQDAYETETA